MFSCLTFRIHLLLLKMLLGLCQHVNVGSHHALSGRVTLVAPFGVLWCTLVMWASRVLTSPITVPTGILRITRARI